MGSLFERLGGAPAVEAAVDLFYDRLLADPRVNRFFAGIDMEKQRRHQVRFLTYAFGGLPNYPGRSMESAHRRLVDEHGLDDGHFDAILENLAATLRQLGVPEPMVLEAAAIAESVRGPVLGRAA